MKTWVPTYGAWYSRVSGAYLRGGQAGMILSLRFVLVAGGK